VCFRSANLPMRCRASAHRRSSYSGPRCPRPCALSPRRAAGAVEPTGKHPPRLSSGAGLVHRVRLGPSTAGSVRSHTTSIHPAQTHPGRSSSRVLRSAQPKICGSHRRRAGDGSGARRRVPGGAGTSSSIRADGGLNGSRWKFLEATGPVSAPARRRRSGYRGSYACGTRRRARSRHRRSARALASPRWSRAGRAASCDGADG